MNPTCNLNEDNILMFSIVHYDNKYCSGMTEFFEDYKKVTYIMKKFTQYDNNNKLKDRLILNYLISLYNVFEPIALTRILFFRIPNKHHSILKTFLVFLNRIGEHKPAVMIDNKVANILRKI